MAITVVDMYAMRRVGASNGTLYAGTTETTKLGADPRFRENGNGAVKEKLRAIPRTSLAPAGG
jgi:hypothetical protein